ncbi:MAG: lipoyl synthase [Candidatus Omnitrophica bacterium]|nr:lipoyl synthase [Candidatus Omnitrophota bacterium]
METTRKPDWLKKKIDLAKCLDLHRLFGQLELNTVCKEAHCPNISECFSAKVATFLILGNICTRKCRFCAVKKGIPQPIDSNEPQRLAEAVKKLGLKHVVITSVTRDDLADGGAEAFVQNIKGLKFLNPGLKVEVLVPDFQGDARLIKRVIQAGCDIFAHNIETVPELYSQVRADSDYQRSLKVLKTAKEIDCNIYVKSGIMLGLGETEKQLSEVLTAIKKTGCDFLSIGQYLAPSKSHYPVKEFIHPDKFVFYKQKAEELGFTHVESGAYVRSSYLASEYL